MSTLLPHNQQLLDFIRARQPISTADLFAGFEGAGGKRQAFHKRLNYLKNQGWLLNKNSDTGALWHVNPNPPAVERPAVKAKPAPASVWVGPVVQPRQVHVMGAPDYTPKPATYRPGALDYARYPSHVCGEVRPFKGGM